MPANTPDLFKRIYCLSRWVLPLEEKKGSAVRLSSKVFNYKEPCLSRSFRLHRPRGYLCGIGMCPNCMMRVGGTPNVRICTRRVNKLPDMEIQNKLPLLDSLGLTQVFSRVLGPGFQYRHFNDSRFMSKMFFSTLKRTAGIGRVPSSVGGRSAWQRLEVDCLVIGGGYSGMKAALAAAGIGDLQTDLQSDTVLMLDSFEELGGDFGVRWGKAKPYTEEMKSMKEEVQSMMTKINSSRRINCLCNSTAVGYYKDENCILALSEDTIYEITAKNVLVATGGHEVLPIFPNNDSPRVVLSLGLQILMNDGAELPSSATVVDLNGLGTLVAADLIGRGGMDSVSLVRSGSFTDKEEELASRFDIKLLPKRIISDVAGSGRVKLLSLAEGGLKEQVADLVVICGRYQPNFELALQLGLDLQLVSEGKGVFTVKGMSGSKVSNVRAVRSFLVKDSNGEGVHVGYDTSFENKVCMDITADEYLRRFMNSPDSFGCICEDVSVRDLCRSIDEGYDYVESLKRYTGCLTGPCQGKQCAMTVASILYMKNPHSQGFLTTPRQPIYPIPFSSLVSQ
jgi:sarcosine oxidase subunit alpha